MWVSRSAIVGLSLALVSCGQQPEEDEFVVAAATASATVPLYNDLTKDAIGKSETASPSPIDQSTANPFFRSFGTNGRTCGTCHLEAQGWTITPASAKSLPKTDPLFIFDGSDCLPPGVPNPNPTARSTELLAKGLIRIELGIPSNADYTLVSYTDSLNCPIPPSAANLRMYRRPLPTANTAFLSTVMWDGRENVSPPNNTIPMVQANLAHQSNDATRGHAQALADLSPADQASIVSFETGLFNAQKTIDDLKLRQNEDDDADNTKVRGGAKYLDKKVLPGFFLGVNDVLGCAIPNSCDPGRTPAPFTSTIFTIFANWEPGGDPPTDLAASIGRGERLFNTRSFTIDNVSGINRDPTDPVSGPLTGFCGTCHDTPNIGNHSTTLPIDIGITTSTPVGGLDIRNLPTYTFRETATGRTISVTDPGRGLISGRFKDIGKTKGPILRALSARAPYFHNGSAATLAAVVDFYDARFHIGLTAREKADLAAFLSAL